MDTFLIILGVIAAIAAIIGMYYILKLLLRYILTIIVFGVIGAVIGAVIGNYLAKPQIVEYLIYGAMGGSIIGLIIAIYKSSDYLKGHFASSIAKDIMKGGDPVGTKYTIRDQYGNTKTVTKTGNGILGESYLEDDNGNSYKKEWGDNNVTQS